ncbi:MAG: FtsX-like permease family protein [Wenzhouxiangella sp.]
MQLLLQFSRRFLYRHPGQLVLALVGIAAGVAVVTGVLLLRDVLLGSLDDASSALSGRDVVRIEAPSGRLDEQRFVSLAAHPSAPDLVPVLSARIRVNGEPFELLGLDPFSLADGGPMRVSGPATGALLGQGHVALLSPRTLDSLPVGLGDPLTIRHAGQDRVIRLLATIEGGPALDNRLIMDLAAAQDLLDQRGQLSWIEADAGQIEALRPALPDDLRLSRSETRRDSAARLTQGMRSNLTALSLLALLVGLFVVYSAFSFLLVQRQAQIGMLRAVGVTPGQLLSLLTIETLVLAGLGGLIGLAAGLALSEALLGLVRAPLAELYGLVAGRSLTPSLGLLFLIWQVTLLLALVSVAGLLKRALVIPPGQLSRQTGPADDKPPGFRTALPAMLLLLSGVGLIVLSDALPGALVALFLLLAGCALLVPATGLWLLGRLASLSRRGLLGRAVGMLQSARQRLAPALAALSLALGLSAGIAMMVLGFRASVDDWVDRLLRAPVYLTAQSGIIDQAVVDAVQGWPEVAELSSARERTMADGRRLIAYDLPAAAWAGFDWLAPAGGADWQAFQAGQGVLASEAMARRHDLVVGEPVELIGPGETRALPLLGIYRDYASDRGALAVDARLYREWFDDPQRDSLGLYFEPGISAIATDRLDELPGRFQLTRREAVRDQTMAVFDRTFRITWALAILVGIIAVIALTSALLALGLERRRDYATLRALGLPPAGLARWVVSQTLGLAMVAALLAIPISLLIHSVLSLVIQPRAFGWSVAMSLPWQVWLFLLPVALLSGLIAGLYPARVISRRDPAPMLRPGT